MLRQPLGPSVDSAANAESQVSSFLNNKEPNPDSIAVWRSQKVYLEDVDAMSGCREEEGTDENQMGSSSEVVALHSSFDAALLESEKSDSSIFSVGRHDRTPRTKSWDEYDIGGVADTVLGELSGRKHLRQHAQAAEMFQTGTVRKLPRRSPNMPGPPPGSVMKKKIGSLTPNSVSKRRQRTPFHQRKSPGHKGVPPTPASSSKLKPPQALTPTRPSEFSCPATVVKASAKSNGTGVTTETSVDTDSHGTSSPSTTPFRFTSFPASLPRVNNPRSVDRGFNSPLPVWIKKRMTFAEDNNYLQSTAPGDGDSHPQFNSSRPLHLLSSQCRDDDGTHNSSISSWSAEGGQHMTYSAPSVPPTVLEWKSPANESDMDTDDAGKKHGTHPKAPLDAGSFPAAENSGHAQLFVEDDDYGYSDDEEPVHLGGAVGRTRLNFNLMLSPNQNRPKPDGCGKEAPQSVLQQETQDSARVADNSDGATKMDLSRTYEQRRTNSFPSSVSTNTPLRNVSGYDESATASTTAFSPSRSGAGSGPIVALLESGRPQTPEEVQIHFHVDEAQCSPIPGILEEGVDRGMLAPRFSSTISGNEPITGTNTGKLHISGSEDSGGSSTTSSKMRKLRPMPDISAFETGGTTRSASSSRETKSDDSSAGVDGSAMPPSPKLLCPPTPVRTPAWAHAEHAPATVFTRTNSLIVTKVLATCPSSVLDGHSSLENSLLEDDENASSTIEQRRASLSFSTVDEEMEGSNSPNRRSSQSADRVERDSFSAHSSSPFRTSNTARTVTAPVFPLSGAESQSEGSTAKHFSRVSGGNTQVGSPISLAKEFDNLGELGSGTFADVFKVRSRSDKQLYAVKRNRRRFRGKRDRDMALTEVRTMQRLQSVCAEAETTNEPSTVTERTRKSLYLLFFFRAWQEDGYFFCQTELCCRDTCREMIESLRSQWNSAKNAYPSLLRNLPTGMDNGSDDMDTCGRLLPEITLWKICHDVCAGLSHIHLHGMVHQDIKPSNVFLVAHSRLGALCKIGDFGMAGDIGTAEDGQEGDTIYMAPELLSSCAKHPSADMFSLGLTLYELAASASWTLPSEGQRWHVLRSGSHVPELPQSRDAELSRLVQTMINPAPTKRPVADKILELAKVREAGAGYDQFLGDYINDVSQHEISQDRRRQLERKLSAERGQTPRNIPSDTERTLTPTPEAIPILFTPEPK